MVRDRALINASAKMAAKTKKKGAPDCYQCKWRQNLNPLNPKSKCTNENAKALGTWHGIRNGFFYWPYEYSPRFLRKCNGFEQKPMEQRNDNDKRKND